jgi:DNA (cytosine-5)-methyltransferase 1
MSRIRVGTDCSGIEAPIQALERLKIPYHHCFSSDIDEKCRESILANYSPDILFTDMKARDVDELPDIDLYIAGFPCQAFSSAGKRKGTSDARGTLFWECYSVIDHCRPDVFILENVKGLLSIHDGEWFEEIIDSLDSLDYYDLWWDVLDTKDYGIPQHRERLFIVGIRRGFRKTEFEFPKKKKMKDIRDFVDETDTHSQAIPDYVKRSGLLKRIPKDAVFIDIGFTQNNFPHSDEYSPTLTASANMWCVPMSRYANIKELLSLQGFPKRFKQVVSDSQLKKQIGNSMSVCVVEEILKKIYL